MIDKTKRKKILIISDPLDNQYAGVYTFTNQFLHALHQIENNSLIIYLVTIEDHSKTFPNFHHIIIPIHASNSLSRTKRLFYSIPKKAIEFNIDIVVELVHFGPWNLPKKIKRVNFIHDLTPILFPEYHVFMGWFLHRIFLRRILLKASLVLTNSEHSKSDLLRLYPFISRKTKVIHLGVDQIFEPTSNSKVLEKYSIHEEYILFVGTIEPRKNIKLLISAFEFLKSRNRFGGKLVLIGKKGWKSKTIIHSIFDSSYRQYINWLGYVKIEDLPALYSHAKLFVFPSIYEGFGLSVLEAMACGTPCLVSKSSSLTEVGGNAVEYFKEGDLTDLSNKLAYLLNGETKLLEMARKSKQQASKFSWHLFANSFIQALSEVDL